RPRAPAPAPARAAPGAALPAAPRPAPSAPDAAPAVVPAATGAADRLRAAVTSPDLGEAADAVAAIGLAGGPRAAALLYPALDGVPELRRQAALALGRIGAPEAAAHIRASLDKSSDRLRVELAAGL